MQFRAIYKKYRNGKFEDNRIIHEKQNLQDAMKEYMILGLRKLDGVRYEEFNNVFGKSINQVFKNEVDKLVKEGLIEEGEYSIKLSKKGLDFANVVWAEFV